MEWNAEGQLKRVTLNGNEVARFSYDPNGRRVEKVAGGGTTSYLHDGAAILREVRGSATLKFIHGLSTDEPLAREDASGALTYYHADGLGSVVRRTSQVGAVVHEYQYDAWGNIRAGASEPGYAYTGREWDPEAGLYYYRARYYDSNGGRFISEDPIGFGGNANFYVYVGNRPIDRVDPSGLVDLKKMDEAAIKAMRGIDVKCLKLRGDEEYYGNLCECNDAVVAGEPVLGKSGDKVPPCTSGRTLVGFYHCHSKDGAWPELFSQDDIFTIDVFDKITGYLLTPRGIMKRKRPGMSPEEIGRTW